MKRVGIFISIAFVSALLGASTFGYAQKPQQDEQDKQQNPKQQRQQDQGIQ